MFNTVGKMLEYCRETRWSRERDDDDALLKVPCIYTLV